ncbi:3-keto-steroid reductase [Marasmius tenuissimus]|uniref:3-keto-steroid reductase n=1 Tax=Marasmius tenuissimus TaxID=585030 RepID=A0ABR2ZB04_9AGAR
MSKPRPIIVVTGANGGVGFGICQRLLFQLSEVSPLDTRLRPAGERKEDRGNASDDQLAPCDGLTLILACRNTKRAEAAKEKLLKLLDEHVAKLQTMPGYDGHPETFRENSRIEVYELDLGMLSTVTKFASEVARKIPFQIRIRLHLICNAGVATFNKISWWKAAKQLLVTPYGAVTTPMFYSETWGETSPDGYGWVWQCNVFGHYFLFRELQPLLLSTNASIFVQARLLGSIYHPITFEKGALAAVWLSIISLSSISTMFVSTTTNGHTDPNTKTAPTPRPPVKFGSCCDRWGNPLVGLQPIECWDAKEAERLVERCEETYEKEKARQRWKSKPEKRT